MAKRSVCMTLDPEVVDEAKRQCERYGLTLSQTVNELLKAFIRTGEGNERQTEDVRSVQEEGSDTGDGSAGWDTHPDV